MALQLADDRNQPCDLALCAIRLAARRLELFGMARHARPGAEPAAPWRWWGEENQGAVVRRRVNHIAAFLSHDGSLLSYCVARSKRGLRRRHPHRANPRPVETIEQAESCDDVRRITPSLIAGQRNELFSSRLPTSTSPVPSHNNSFTRSARLARNT